MSSPATPTAPAGSRRATVVGHGMMSLFLAYALLLAVMAYLGRWTPAYLEGRDLWHFLFPRMLVAMVMLGVIASFIRIVPAALLLSSILLIGGTISAIKRESTGEPFQISDIFLTGQSGALLGYVSWDKWLVGLLIVPAVVFCCAQHAHQTLEPARGFVLRRSAFDLPPGGRGEMDSRQFLLDRRREPHLQPGRERAHERLRDASLLFDGRPPPRLLHRRGNPGSHWPISTTCRRMPARTAPAPDIFIVLGEAWWRDPADEASPLDSWSRRVSPKGPPYRRSMAAPRPMPSSRC